MIRRYTLALILAVAFTVGGCANYIKKGDKAMLAGRAADALKYYQKALDKKSALGSDPEFMGKMKVAGSRASYMQGRSLARAKKWDAAIEQLNKALEIDPEFSDAKIRLAKVKKEASTDFHTKALAAADQGKLDEAKQHIKRAVELDNTNTDARDASDSANNIANARLTTANTLYEEALQSTARKHWGQAGGTLAAALQANSNHIPAHVLQYQCKAKINEADGIFNQGVTLLGQKRLDKSIAKFDAAIGVWPSHPNATTKLNNAKALRKRAEDLYNQAVKLADDKKWDQAVAIAKMGVDIYPYHGQSPALLAKAKQHAAAAHYEVANGLLDKSRFDDAEKEYRRALQYQPDMLAAKDGVALVNSKRGDKEVQAGNWGSALLWYIEAQDYSTSQKYKNSYARAHAAVTQRIGFNLLVKINPPQENPSITVQELNAKLSPALGKRKTGYISFGAQKAADYEISITPKLITINTAITGTENKLHAYKIEQQAANPEIQRLETLIRDARRDLERAEDNRYRRCTHCRGTGRVTSNNQQVACSRCNGTGRVIAISDHEINRKRRHVRDLRNELRNTPATVIVLVPAQWKYILKGYHKTGELGGHMAIKDAAGKSVGAFTLKSSSNYTDTTIEGANPAIGLEQNPLSLPDDATIRSRMIEKIADVAAEKMISEVVKARIAATGTDRDKLTQAGKTAEALEKKVDILLLAEAFDAAAAQKSLKQLQSSRR